MFRVGDLVTTLWVDEADEQIGLIVKEDVDLLLDHRSGKPVVIASMPMWIVLISGNLSRHSPDYLTLLKHQAETI